MRTSDEVSELAAALVKAQAAMKPATKDATNPHFKSKYADLAAIVSAIQKPFTDAGVSWVQDVTREDGGIGVTTRLMHASGQWIEFGPLVIPVDKANAHGVGSAATYAKRYGLAAACGVATVDDDGNSATAAPPKAEAPSGFEDWLTDLEATADSGVDALKSAWAASTPAMRKFLTDTDNAKWEYIKELAKHAEGAGA